MTFEVIRSETVYQGRVFAVRHDQVKLPDGKTTQLDIISHSGAVTLIPVDDEGRIWFVRQYRHAAGETLLELPAGTLEKGEPPAACAAREVREEIGMSAGKLQHLGEFFLAPGYSTEFMHIYLATELHPDPMQHDDDEFLTVEPIPIHQAYALALDGRIRDGKSLAALLLARPHLSD